MTEETKVKNDDILYIGPVAEIREEGDLTGAQFPGLSALCVTRVGGRITGRHELSGETKGWYFDFPRTHLTSVDVDADWDDNGKRGVWISLSFHDIPGYERDIYLLSFHFPRDGSPSYFSAGIEG